MDPFTTAHYVSYYLTIFLTTFVLIWALKLVAKALTSQPPGSAQPLIASILSEPEPDPAKPAPDDKGSFSRTAGAFGASGMAAVFTGIGYWLLHALFFTDTRLVVLKDVSWYFLAGSAMFFPYAFNQLAKIFK